jgi:daunosaminyl-N,N-dimethyltransferase/N-dimethyltransferase
MYGRRAEYYDLIYHWKDYAAEAAALRARLGELGIGEGSTILEAGCGTGSHLVHLRDAFQLRGFDVSEGMLEIARKKLPGTELFRADMAELTDARPVDAVISLFGAIAYVFPIERLRATAQAVARVVRPGGALLVEPFLTEDQFTAGKLYMQTADREEIKLCRMSHSRKKGQLAEITFHWLVLFADGATDQFSETHALWLIAPELLLQVFGEAGFDVRYDPEGVMPGRALVVGRRR